MHPETLKPVATAPVAKHLVSADGTAVYAEAIGNPANPHLVFMHGFSLSTIVWDCIFHDPRYFDQFYLVRYDLRGHGRSGKPQTAEGYTSEKFAQDFAAVLEGFGLKRPVFVGWSLGSTVTLDIAAHLPPKTLSGVVCLASLPYFGDAAPRIMSEYIGELAAGSLRNDDVGAFLATKTTFLDSLFSDPDKVSHELKCLWLGASVAATPKDLVLGFARTQNQNPEPLFAMVRDGTLPLLVLQGSVDQHLVAEMLVAEAESAYKGAEVVVFPGRGHALFYEDLDAVMERIVSFVGKLRV